MRKHEARLSNISDFVALNFAGEVDQRFFASLRMTMLL
jgi:hypothetical protein